jgi:hypothetical protein
MMIGYHWPTCCVATRAHAHWTCHETASVRNSVSGPTTSQRNLNECVGDLSLAGIADACAAASACLQQLDLSSNRLWFRSASQLFRNPMPHITHIDLSHNLLGDRASVALAVALQQCPALVELRLADCGLTGAMFADGRVLAAVRNLHRLDLSLNCSGAPALTDLLRPDTRLPQLQDLSLAGWMVRHCVLCFDLSNADWGCSGCS